MFEKSGAHHDWALKKILSSKFSQIDFELIEKALRLSYQDSFESDAPDSYYMSDGTTMIGAVWKTLKFSLSRLLEIPILET